MSDIAYRLLLMKRALARSDAELFGHRPRYLEVARRLAALLLVRPAWARSWRCKSSAELATARQAKRNCVRATERGEEAWSVNREPRYTNRI